MSATALTSVTARASFDAFRAVIGMPIDDAVIAAIAERESRIEIRAAIDAKDRSALLGILTSFLARETIVAINASSLDPAVVRKALVMFTFSGYLRALREAKRGQVAELARFITEATLAETAPEPAPAPAAPPVSARLAPPPDEALPGPQVPVNAGTSAQHARPQREQAASNVAQLGPRPPRAPRPAPAGAVAVRGSLAPLAPRESAAPLRVRSEEPPRYGDRDPAPASAAGQAQPRKFQTVHVYNQKRDNGPMIARAAACFELTTRPDEKSGREEPALKVETAGPHPSDRTRYHWDDKIIFYLTEDELPVLLSVMLGLLPRCEFRNHGKLNNKSLKLDHQGKHMYLTMNEGKDKACAVQLDVGRSTRVATLVARAFQAVNDDLDWGACRDILSRLTAPMQKAKQEAAAQHSGGGSGAARGGGR